MERFIRDKYERQAFKKGSPSIPPKATAAEGQRFSPQLARLAEMGFSDGAQNAKVLRATHGNLQEALDILGAGRAGHGSSPFDPLSTSPTAKAGVSDLVDISFESTPQLSEGKADDGMFTQPPTQKHHANVESGYDAFDSPW